MSTYQALLARRDALDAQINAAKVNERNSALAEVRRLVGGFDISVREIFGASRTQKGQRRQAKYRDPETGATWSGRGRRPAWIAGKDRVQFEIAPATTRA
ncbi:H-NS histone family protein [Burkholderia sp. AU33545]|uniref:H-NS histone family protein n=1 Tax=Burkholderia sp. AU33545 TaxID=2879631 RepID=UPI001CF59B1C|nr:H-NS histone family protein [Burkholderia sp. AU33545]MCA8205166.1 H-NS histone family protein [Burkholderia sp. AU33545]